MHPIGHLTKVLSKAFGKVPDQHVYLLLTMLGYPYNLIVVVSKGMKSEKYKLSTYQVCYPGPVSISDLDAAISRKLLG